MRGRGGKVSGGSGGAIDPRNLHLKKELTQIRKAARVLRDPGTTSSWQSPHNAERSIPKKQDFHHHNNGGRHSVDDNVFHSSLVHFHHHNNGGRRSIDENVFRSSSQQLFQLPLQVENGNSYSNIGGANNSSNVNVVKKDRKVFLYNWRNKKSESDRSRQIGEDDVENAKDNGSSSTTEESVDIDSSSDARNGGANDSKSDTCLSERYDNLKKQNISSRDAKYVAKGISDLGLGRDDFVSLMEQYDDTEDSPNSDDDLRRDSAISPLLARLQNKDCVHSPLKLSKSRRKEDDSISHIITPAMSNSSYKFGVRNPSTIGSWDATLASFNNAEDEVEDHLDFSWRPGCGIPCYRSTTSTPKFRGNDIDSGSPSLSDTLRRKGSSIFCGSRSLSQRRRHQSSLGSNKRPSSRAAGKGLLPLLSADSQEGSSMGSEKSDNELTTTFGELDLEAMSRLDGRRWSTSCRSQEGLARFFLNGEISSPENIKSLSQKYRPMFFDELFGQSLVVQSLMSSISKGRIAPVYLFHGPRGTGKTSAARIFAAALNCLATEETKPCGVCRECADFISGKSKDLKELDVSSKKGIDRVKNLFRNLSGVTSSAFSQYIVFVIDKCHLLTSKTWPAFLRFLEKPLPHVLLILVTTDCDNIPRTILSRCQMHLFNKISNGDIITRLRKISAYENLDVDANALDLIASNADGSLRDAETMLDQLSLLGKRVTTSLVNEHIGVVSDEKLLVLLELAMSSKTTETVIRARELMDSGVDPIVLMSQLATLIVDIIAGTYPSIDVKLNNSFFGGRSLSERELDKLKHALMLLSEAEKHLRVSSEQSTWFTATLLQLGSVPSPDRTQSGNGRRQSFKTNEEHHIHTFREATAQKQRSDAANFNPDHSRSTNSEALAIRRNGLVSAKTKSSHMNTNALIDIWVQCVEKCHSRTLRHLLHTYGKLVSISEVQGCFVVYIAFADSNIKARAEGFLSSITNSFEIVLRRNVEVKIILLPNSICQRQMDPIISMEHENKSICSSAIEVRSNPDSLQKPPKISRGSFNDQTGPSQCGTGNDRVQRIESIILEQRLETARLQAMEKCAPASTNRLKPERNQVLPQDGSNLQNNMDSLTSIDLPLQHWEDELNREIKGLKINEETESQMDNVIKRISPYPISPSLLHNSSFATNFCRDKTGYESGSGGGGCSKLFCWNKSKLRRREKAKQRTPTRRRKSGRFSLFTVCAKSRRTHNRYRR